MLEDGGDGPSDDSSTLSLDSGQGTLVFTGGDGGASAAVTFSDNEYTEEWPSGSRHRF